MILLRRLLLLLAGEAGADRVVPRRGSAPRLTLLAAGAMAFVAVLTLSLGLAAGRMAADWSDALAGSATVMIAAPPEELAAETATMLRLLQTTPGIAGLREVPDAEKRERLAAWLGTMPGEDIVPLPAIIEVQLEGAGPDAESLKLRLQAEAPHATWDDHSRWRAPLAASAKSLRWLALGALALSGFVLVALAGLAAQAELHANGAVIGTLRLIGATDAWVARAFVRRLTLSALWGALGGTVLGLLVLLLLPRAGEGSYLPSLRPQGLAWAWFLLIPPFAACGAFLASRTAAFARLKSLT